MKRTDLVRHLRKHGCTVLRQGEHEVWLNPQTNQRAPVPRHQDVPYPTARSICDRLGIPRLTIK
jgi:mRNA interferase HicA